MSPKTSSKTPLASPLAASANLGYVQLYQNSLKDAFIEAVFASTTVGADAKKLFDQILKAKEIINTKEKEAVFAKIYQSTKKPLLAKVVEVEAKLQDVLRRARKHAATNILSAYKDAHFDQSHSLRSELEKAYSAKIPASELQEYLDKNFRAVFSTTGHPTNPYTLQYTALGYDLDAALDVDSGATKEDLQVLLQKALETPLAGVKKTPIEEAAEAELSLTAIYHSFAKLEKSLENSLAQSSYSTALPLQRHLLTFPSIIIELSVWTHGGDADGNSSINATVLKEGYARLERAIKNLYIEDLMKLAAKKSDEKFKLGAKFDLDGGFPSAEIEKIIAKLQADQYQNPDQLKQDLIDLQYTSRPLVAAELAHMISKVNHFGFHFAKVDIRHNSKDIVATINSILKLSPAAQSLLNGREFKDFSPKEQVDLLAKFLKDEAIIKELSAIEISKITEERSAMIFERLQICGANSSRTEKLIIADAEGPNHALAAMLLLKVTGNNVAEQGASIDIVTLSESIIDLKEIVDVQRALLANETYREHLKYRGRLEAMVAKSDTIRVGGPTAEFYQDEAAGKIYALAQEAKDLYNLDIEARVFNGGGAALQRGGGKPLEVAKRHAEAAIKVGATAKGPSSLTVQGHHREISFGSRELAYNTLEELLVQNLHSSLQVANKIPSKNKPQPHEATRQAFYDKGIETYQAQYFNNPYITELFSNSNRIGALIGNSSSRPNVRGGKSFKIESGVTLAQLYGPSFDLFNTRSITLDRTLAHTGVFAVMFLGLKEAFASIKGSGSTAHQIYEESKPFRDFIRNQVAGLFMVDLDHAWKMMIGSQRPSPEEIASLAPQFLDHAKMDAMDPEQRKKVTLAYLDDYINCIGKEVYATLFNEAAPDKLELKSILYQYNASLAQEMDYREKEASFLKYVECSQTAAFNASDKEATALDQYDLATVASVNAGTDIACNAPIGMSTILSSLQKTKGGDLVRSLASAVEEGNLKFPSCLEVAKKHDKKLARTA